VTFIYPGHTESCQPTNGIKSIAAILNALGNPNMGCIRMFKILIVDPNDPFRQSLKKVLMNRFPFTDIQEASDGIECMEMVNLFEPNLVFLEIHLPAQNGLGLARRLKFDRPDVIIVLLTSYDLPEYQTAAEESGIDHLVPKDKWTGIDMIDLVQLILSDEYIKEHEDRWAAKRTRKDC
jgi:CheY-like chemotaxis protein